MTVTYRRAKTGDWVAYGPVSEVREGPVRIRKKDGSEKIDTVVRLGAPFATAQGDYVYGYLAPKSTSDSGRSNRSRAPHGMIECDECGDFVRPGTRCWETGAMH